MTIKNNRNYVIRKLENNNKNKPYFLNMKGQTINNPNIMNYVKKWRIPPAYPEVKIFLNVNDNKDDVFYAVGKDNKGRVQQLYTKYHNELRESTKYCKVLEVGKNYHQINSKINTDLKRTRITKDKLIAIILKIMIECQFRPGHEKYKDKYGSFGLTTLLKSHMKNEDNKIQFSFIGKKGVLNECLFQNSNAVEELLKLTKNKKNDESIFSYKDIKVRPEDINNYLRIFGGITAKSIRTWDANREFIKFARLMDEEVSDKITKRKKQLKALVEKVAHKLHHTVAVCKKSYLDTEIFETFVENPERFARTFINKKTIDQALLDFFERKCKKLNNPNKTKKNSPNNLNKSKPNTNRNNSNTNNSNNSNTNRSNSNTNNFNNSNTSRSYSNNSNISISNSNNSNTHNNSNKRKLNSPNTYNKR